MGLDNPPIFVRAADGSRSRLTYCSLLLILRPATPEQHIDQQAAGIRIAEDFDRFAGTGVRAELAQAARVSF